MIEDEKNLHSGHRKRMRERMLAGSDFSTHELLEMLLAYGIPRKNTNDIAHRLPGGTATGATLDNCCMPLPTRARFLSTAWTASA